MDKSHYPSAKTITQEELLSSIVKKCQLSKRGNGISEAFRNTDMYQCHHHQCISGILAPCKELGDDAVDKA